LQALAFSSTSDNPTNADRTATVTFSDGGNSGAGSALTDSSTVTVHVSPVNDPPVAGDDAVITNIGTNSPIQIADWILMLNDTDPDSTLSITGVTSTSAPDTATHASGVVTFTDKSPSDGSFNYTVSDGLLS